MNIHKNILSVMIVLSVGYLCVPLQATEGDTLFRKCLGIVGAGLMVNGLWKVVQQRPGKGVVKILAGAVVAIGGICSDIIANRTKAYMEQGSFKNLLATGYEGGFKAIGNVVWSEEQMSGGLRTLKKGNIITGIDQIYDGVYHNIRARCRMTLYPELWQHN